MSKILMPGAPGIDMQQIQEQAAARTAMIHSMIQNTGSRIYANLAAAYFMGLPPNEPPDMNQLRRLASVGKEMGIFYAEALGFVNLTQTEPEGGKTG